MGVVVGGLPGFWSALGFFLHFWSVFGLFGRFRSVSGPRGSVCHNTKAATSYSTRRIDPRYQEASTIFSYFNIPHLLSQFSVFYDSRILRFRECWPFEFLVKALKDTTPGRCRRLRRLPIPHRRLIQEQHFQNPKSLM